MRNKTSVSIILFTIVVFSLPDILSADPPQSKDSKTVEKKDTPPSRDYTMPFKARDRNEALKWQSKVRAKLLELVETQEPCSDVKQIPIEYCLDGKPQDKGDYTLYSGSFRGNGKEQVRYPIFFTVPKSSACDGKKQRFPAMLCLHGHGGSREAVFKTDTPYRAMADSFARRGYVVLAPSFPHKKYAAMMLWDLIRCVDILQSRDEVDPQRVGVAGLSMGGEWTMWLAACDMRPKVAIVSGWMCTTEGVFSVHNCSCWELPGFVDLLDVCEANLLIAPRPVLFESAMHDGCFPVEHCKKGFARIRKGYELFGAADHAHQDIWPAKHLWHGKKALPLVDSILKQ